MKVDRKRAHNDVVATLWCLFHHHVTITALRQANSSVLRPVLDRTPNHCSSSGTSSGAAATDGKVSRAVIGVIRNHTPGAQ